jgi:antitoxin VapB
MGKSHQVKLTRSGRHQILHIPSKLELPGDRALIYRRGDHIVIAPLRKRNLLALLDAMEPFDEDFPDIDSSLMPANNPTS